MTEIVVAEADLDRSVRESLDRAPRDASGSPANDVGGAVHVLRVSDASGVVFHPSGPARTGGYNHLGLKLED